MSWNRVYSIWSTSAPAAQLHTVFLRTHREATYRTDSSYPTVIFDTTTRMVLLARRDLIPAP